MNGLINLLKPPGMSSAQAVSFVKRTLGCKVGHAGTLDPEAAGVLPLMIGRATKLFDYITEDHKVYLAEIAFGYATDTEDAQGNIVGESSHLPDEGEIRRALADFAGAVMQRPPAFSALKQGGERLYALARRGNEVELSARPVFIEKIEYLGRSDQAGCYIRVHCGKGTYIRSLCRDIGERVGSKAHMRFLLRERVGAFVIGSAVTPEEVAEQAGNGLHQPECLLSPDLFLQHLSAVYIPVSLAKKVMNGVPVACLHIDRGLPENVPLRTYIDDVFIGIAERKGDMLSMRTLYALNVPSA